MIYLFFVPFIYLFYDTILLQNVFILFFLFTYLNMSLIFCASANKSPIYFFNINIDQHIFLLSVHIKLKRILHKKTGSSSTPPPVNTLIIILQTVLCFCNRKSVCLCVISECICTACCIQNTSAPACATQCIVNCISICCVSAVLYCTVHNNK